MTAAKTPVHGKPHQIIGSDPVPPMDWHTVGDPGEPDFENDWGGYFRFRLNNEGSVELEGEPTGGAFGTTVFTLPEWARPPADAGNDLIIEVLSTGEVSIVDVIDGGSP